MKSPQPATQDKLILLLLLMVLVTLLVYFTKCQLPDGFQWAERAYDNIQGALLMLLTGRALSSRRDDTNDKTTNGGGVNGYTALPNGGLPQSGSASPNSGAGGHL